MVYAKRYAELTLVRRRHVQNVKNLKIFPILRSDQGDESSSWLVVAHSFVRSFFTYNRKAQIDFSKLLIITIRYLYGLCML